MEFIKKNIEQMKTGLIVVLLFITVLLLYFLWGGNIDVKNIFGSDSNYVEEEQSNVNIYTFFKPSQGRINFGGDNYTIIYSGMDNLWDIFLTSFFPQNSNESRSVEEITEEKWAELLIHKSIEFDLGFDFPFDETNKLYNTGGTMQFNSIRKVSKMLYTEVSPKDFFVFDNENKKYFRIMTENEYPDIFEEIDNLGEENYDKYNAIKNYFGVDNNTLMPYSLKNNIYAIECEQEIYYHEENKITGLAEKFFGDNFDFVRKIVETEGTIIYMYGYGTKSLVISNEGQIRYEEAANSNNRKGLGCVESLNIAINYIMDHGDWKTLKGKVIYPYLKNIKENDRGYSFVFGYRINGYPVYYENDEAFEIEIMDGQVTYYKRYILNQKDTVTIIRNDEEAARNIVTANITITNNFDRFKAIYSENGYDFSKMEYEEAFNHIVNSIQDVRISYFLKENEENLQLEFVPAWVFISEEARIYFSIDAGQYLGLDSIK